MKLLDLFLTCLLILLAWIISRRPQQNIPLNTYDGDYYFSTDKVNSPDNLQDIQSIIVKANTNGQKIKVLGAGHSRSPIALSENHYISLHNYHGLVSIDTDKKLASFRGGSKLGEILSILASYNLTLPVMPAINSQTIGGAITTGTHGSSLSKGNMALYVHSFKLVISSGEILSVTPETDVYYAAGVGLGMFGVITEVTLKCVDSFSLREVRSTHSLSYCRDHLLELASKGDFVKFWVEINSKNCFVFVSNVTTDHSRDKQSNQVNSLKMIVWEIFQWLFSVFPFTTSNGMIILFSTNFFFPPYDRVDTSTNIQVGDHYMSPNKQTEISVAVENCVNALDTFIDNLDQTGIPLNHILEIRFVDADKFWLSNNYDRKSCHLTAMMYNPSDKSWEKFYMSMYHAMLKYNGRPHWGKWFSIAPEELHQLYPKSKEFLKVREELDPKGIFLNKIINDTFGINLK